MQKTVPHDLEAYLLASHFGREELKSCSEIELDVSTETLNYIKDGEPKRLKVSLWDSPSNMFLICLYSAMLQIGYLVYPIEGGWVVEGGEERYFIDPECNSCTCKGSSYNKSSTCKHRLFLKGYWTLERKRREKRAAFIGSIGGQPSDGSHTSKG